MTHVYFASVEFNFPGKTQKKVFTFINATLQYFICFLRYAYFATSESISHVKSLKNFRPHFARPHFFTLCKLAAFEVAFVTEEFKEFIFQIIWCWKRSTGRGKDRY